MTSRPGRPSVGGTTFRISTLAGDITTRPIIIGAGVAGVASAIALLDCGLDPVILEQRSGSKLVGGAGINCQATAISALAKFGVPIEVMKKSGRVIKKQSYYAPDGRHVGSLDKSGTGDVPGQIGIHRGKLVQLLMDVAKSRDIAVLMRHHVSTIDTKSTPGKIIVKADIRSNALPTVLEGSMVLGADGINSLVRRHYISGNRDADPQRWHGATHYRGVCENYPGFLDRETMILAGGVHGVKAVVYPISNPDENGYQTINWVLAVEENEIHEDKSTYKEHILKLVKEQGFDLGFLDVYDLLSRTPDIEAWPMVDLDPLDTWTDDRIALSGDAAHGMLPVGSGGAMAALLDALALKEAFEKNEDDPIPDILKAYEALRKKDATLHQGKCRLQPAENIVQEAMDKVPMGEEVPAEYEQRLRDVMKTVHNPTNKDPPVGVILSLGVTKGIITEEQAGLLMGLSG